MLWEVGVLLMGIGILILCIFTATTIRDVGSMVKRIDQMLTNKDGEINTIIEKSASITNEIDGIVTNVNKVTDVVGFVSGIVSGISAGRSKKYQDDEDIDIDEDELDEILKEENNL